MAEDQVPARCPLSPAARVAWGYLALAAPALFVFGDTALSYARGWRTNSRLDRAGLIALGMWLTVTTILLALPLGRRIYRQRFAQFMLLVTSIGASWLVAELSLGPMLAQVADPFHCRHPGSKFLYRPKPGIMRDVGPEAHVEFNSWGIRGSDPPDRAAAYRILCLGSSSTACTYLDDAKAWPQVLAQELHAADPAHAFWVGTAAMPGFTTRDHRRFAEQSPLLQQIDCLIVQAGINDFQRVLAGPRPIPPLWRQSRVWQLVRTLLLRSATSGIWIEDAAGRAYAQRRAIRQAAQVDSAEPMLDPGLREYGENIRQIIGACKARHVPVIFSTQPVLWRADLESDNAALLWFGRLADGRFLAVDQLRRGMDRYNEVLGSTCNDCGVQCIDLSELNGDPEVFYDDCHFTETGARRVARLISDWMVAHPDAVAIEAAR